MCAQMKRFNVAWLVGRVGWGALLASLVACGQSPGAGGSRQSGAVGLGLQLAPGVTVSQAAYTISGPNGFFSGGNVAIGESTELLVAVGSLPLGVGYELNLTARASDGLTICEAKSLFDVPNGNPQSVSVHLECAVPSGELALSDTLNVCPMIDSLGASPTDVKVGGLVTLTSAAHDSDLGPSSLSYKWTINGAALPPQSAANLNFACSQPGTFDFALSVSDGDITPGCVDDLSVVARCSAL